MSSLKKTLAKYPRLQSAKKYKPGTELPECNFCHEKATHKIWIEHDFMRGNDEDYKVCDEHLRMSKNLPKQLFEKLEINQEK